MFSIFPADSIYRNNLTKSEKCAEGRIFRILVLLTVSDEMPPFVAVN